MRESDDKAVWRARVYVDTRAGALKEGHFVLSSGLHSPVFLQKNRVFMEAERSARLCQALAAKIKAKVGELGQGLDIVVSPAVGAIIPGYETGRQLGLPSIFVEREAGAFKLRRGFSLEPGAKVVISPSPKGVILDRRLAPSQEAFVKADVARHGDVCQTIGSGKAA